MNRAIAVVLCAAACAEPQHADPGQAQRIAALEQQVAGQQRQIDELKAQLTTPTAQLEALQAQLAQLERQAGELRAAPPPPPPRRTGPQPDVVYSVRVGDSP